jgi:hypothetical protein
MGWREYNLASNNEISDKDFPDIARKMKKPEHSANILKRFQL